MDKDLKITLASTTLNIKVGVLLKYKDKFLIEFNTNTNYKTIPSGKIKINEKSKDALIRELKEELKLNLNYDELVFSKTIENIYTYKNNNYHEILFLYKYTLQEKEYKFLINNLNNKDDKTSYFKFINKEQLEKITILPEEVKITMNQNYFIKHEKSCGAIIMKDKKALIIKQTDGHWSLPKGHMEKGETEIDTALREIKEETGLDVKLDTNFRKTIHYCPNKSDTIKEVVFFMAKPVTNKITMQEEEVIDYKWKTLEEIKELFKNRNDQEIIKSAIEYINTSKR